MEIVKRFSLVAICFLIAFSSIAKDVYVKGYYKKDGTYVAPHYRSNPNATVNDNWSTYGNINPHTGEFGTKRVHDRNYKLSNNVVTPSPYISDDMGQIKDTTPLSVTKEKQKNSLDFFWQTLIVIFFLTLFLAPLIDRWLSNLFSQRQYFASLFSLKSFAVVYILVPFILNILFHIYLKR